MKTRKALAILAACIGFVAALDDPAHSKEALWRNVGAWTVSGDSQLQSCNARVEYNDGVVVVINFSKQLGASLAIGGTTAKRGTTYRTQMVASNGSYGRLEGIGLGDGVVLYANLGKDALRTLKNSRALFVDGLGSYNLKHSAAAMASAWECFETLQSY